MIHQRYRTLVKKPSPSINQCLKIANIAGKPYVITGGNEQKAYVYNIDFEIVQTIDFAGWIRDAVVIDLDEDKNDELAIASGDNTIRVFKFNDTEGKFVELWRYQFDKKVTAVAGGDINHDGRDEIIAGSWDGSVKVFDGPTGTLLWELQFSDWITTLKILDTNWDGIPEIVLALKNGQMGIINGVTGECYWDFQFPNRINDIDLVVLSQNEYPHLLVGGDDNRIYCFDYMGNLVQITKVEDRIITMTHGDIDRDGMNEIILGLANKHLVVYSSVDDKSEDKEGGACADDEAPTEEIEESTLRSLTELSDIKSPDENGESLSNEKNVELNHPETESGKESSESDVGSEQKQENSNIEMQVVKTDSNDVVELEYRWKATLPNTVTNICVYDLYGDRLAKIVLTGYFKEIRVFEASCGAKGEYERPSPVSKLKSPILPSLNGSTQDSSVEKIDVKSPGIKEKKGKKSLVDYLIRIGIKSSDKDSSKSSSTDQPKQKRERKIEPKPEEAAKATVSEPEPEKKTTKKLMRKSSIVQAGAVNAQTSSKFEKAEEKSSIDEKKEANPLPPQVSVPTTLTEESAPPILSQDSAPKTDSPDLQSSDAQIVNDQIKAEYKTENKTENLIEDNNPHGDDSEDQHSTLVEKKSTKKTSKKTTKKTSVKSTHTSSDNATN